MPRLNPSAKRVKIRFDQAPVDPVHNDASSEASQIESPTPPKESSQASFCNSESSFDRNNPKEKESDSWKPNIVSFPYVKPVGNTRRVLSLKSKRPLKKKSSRIAPFPNLADYVMTRQEGNESDRASVCSSYYGSTSGMSCSSEESGKRGETEIRKTLKKSRSIRLASFGRLRPNSRVSKSRFDQPPPNYSKATSCSEGKKMQIQASLQHDSESSTGSIDESRRNSHKSKPNSGLSSLKTLQTLKRTPSLRPLRILMNKSSFNSKRSSVKKCPQVSEDSSVNKATCSSTLKDSKFPHRVEEMESERISEMKVCRYNYCSLHGHHHYSMPPLKRVLSKRRRVMKTQKSMKSRRQSSVSAQCPDDLMELVETSQRVTIGEPEAITSVGEEEDSDFDVQIATEQRMEFFERPSEGNEDANLAEVLFGETSYTEKDAQENLNQERNLFTAEKGVQETIFKHEETKFECSCLKPDNSITTSCDKVPGSNSGFHELENADLTCISSEPSNIGERSTVDDNNVGETTEDNSVISSVFVCHTLEELGESRDENNGDLEAARETIEQFAPVEDSEPTSTAREVHISKLQQKKHFSMWKLIHQHMVTGGSETRLLEGENEEKQLDETNSLPLPQSSGFSPGFSGSDQNMSTENQDTSNEEIELRKRYAIKMVREAIEKILLPEVQDQSSDNQSISSDITLEQELLEENLGEGGELRISNSTADRTSCPEQEVSLSEEGKKSEKKTTKSWSNLKKWILLQRFIKALEKVKKFNPPKPRHLPLESDLEPEKVCLKPRAMDRKRSSEEWMLDYALQQVVSELVPTQRRKVELLIKAFETVVPPSDEQQIQVKIVKPSEVPEDRTSNSNLELLKVDFASTGQTVKVDGSSGVTGLPFYVAEILTADGNEESPVADNITSSASEDGPFKQLTAVGEVRDGDSDSMEQLTTMHNQKSTITGEYSNFTNSHLPAHPLRADVIVSTCTDEVSNVTSEFCTEDDPELHSENSESGYLTGPPSIKKRDTSDDMPEEAAENTVTSSGRDCGPMEDFVAAREQKHGDSELDNESIVAFGSFRDSELDNSGHEAYMTQFGKEKHVSMWHLIHQHMVAGLAVEGKTKNLNKENEEHIGEANTMAATESSGSCPNLGSSNQIVGMEYQNTDSQEIELRKMFAIKLVREAIEKILLPELQDQSSDDQSVTSEIMPYQELIEKSHGDEGGKPSISTSAYSSKDRSMDCNSNMVSEDVPSSQEGTRLATANTVESENGETSSKAQNKSDKQTPKGWSNLKKLILLQRFVKQLEKVKKFKPQKSRLLPLKPDLEGEEVSLRHQVIDERKSAEEWMLDYALRKVVGELAPKQKRKVALLVKAFETVAPPSEPPQIQVTFPEFKDTNRDCGCSQSEQEKLVSKTAGADMKVKDTVTSYVDNEDTRSTSTDGKSDVAVDEENQEEAHKDTVSSVCLEHPKDKSEPTGKTTKLNGFGGVNIDISYQAKSAAPDGGREPATYNIASSASVSEPLEQVIAAEENKKGDSETECTAAVAYKTQLAKQKHISMWHLLCQHVVSDIATKVESQHLDGEEDEQVDVAKTFVQKSNGSCHDYVADRDRGKENEYSCSQIIGFSKGDAVKLVREAIEEILSPEIQDDSSDLQSVASDVILEHELLEKNRADVGETSILTSIDSPQDSYQEHDKINQEENGIAAHNIHTPDEKRTASMVGNKSDQQKPKNWSKLKKLILLKRSIKALERARKSNLRAPQNLPLKPHPEEEKVDLKHQVKDEKKKAEEWMLDYALQHIVTKLTPARKRRVSMLVEAFEAVVPLPEV